jgi:two-component system LytT family response regulator
MNQIIKLTQPQLRVAHESEVLLLRRALSALQAELLELKKNMNVSTIKSADRKVVLSSNGQHHLILLNDIIYCEAEGNYTKVFIQQENKPEAEPFSLRSAGRRSRSLLISKTLKSTIDLIASGGLPAKQACRQAGFIRCHQSYFVNKNHVIGYGSNNGLHLKLSTGKCIPVSRRNRKVVLASI